jgi:hypothetical protein
MAYPARTSGGYGHYFEAISENSAEQLFQILGTTTFIPRLISCLAVPTLCHKASCKPSDMAQLARKLKPQPLRHG